MLISHTGTRKKFGINGRRTLYCHMSLADATGNTSLSTTHSTVTDNCMTSDAYLTTKHTPFAYFSRTGHTHLSRHYSISPNFTIMSHLN